MLRVDARKDQEHEPGVGEGVVSTAAAIITDALLR
jgi:hypothetical protein